MGKTTADLMVGDVFDLSTEAQNFIANAGGLSGVRWGLIAGDTSDFNTNVFLTSSVIDLTAKDVANATKGGWANSIIQLIGNLNSGDGSGTEVNNTYGPFADAISSPNYASGGHFDWQSGDADLNNLADGPVSQRLYSFTFTGFVGTVNGVQVLDTATLTDTQFRIGSTGFNPDPADPTTEVVALPDLIGSASPEYVVYEGSVENQFSVKDGNTGSQLRYLNFFSPNWESLAADSFGDGNSDGMPDDNAVIVLGRNINTGQLKVQSRDAATNAVIHNVVFFTAEWVPLGMAVLEDSDGNGVADDPAAAVLAQRTTDGRIMVELRRLSDSFRIGRWAFFRPTWDAKAVTAFVPAGGVPQVAVLGTDPATGFSKVWMRRTTDGVPSRYFFFGSGVDAKDLGVIADLDGNGTADDPALVVLGKKPQAIMPTLPASAGSVTAAA